MIVRVLGILIGVAFLLYILLLRGLPVLFFIKMIPFALFFLLRLRVFLADLVINNLLLLRSSSL